MESYEIEISKIELSELFNIQSLYKEVYFFLPEKNYFRPFDQSYDVTNIIYTEKRLDIILGLNFRLNFVGNINILFKYSKENEFSVIPTKSIIIKNYEELSLHYKEKLEKLYNYGEVELYLL